MDTSHDILQKIKIKPNIQKMKNVEIIIPTDASDNVVEDKTTTNDKFILDRRDDNSFNVDSFMRMLKNNEDKTIEEGNENVDDKKKKNEGQKTKKKTETDFDMDNLLTKMKTKSAIQRVQTKLPALNEIVNIQILDEIVENRIPSNDEHTVYIRKSNYYMNNREVFVNFINKLFHEYRDKVLDNEDTIRCGTTKGDTFSLLTHQQIVRDYINMYTPYRGLLLFHGLGSGKTCSSIAIAESMINATAVAMVESIISQRKIIVMTPASLRMNYIEELKKCGNPIYKKNQFWEFVNIQVHPEYKSILARALSLSISYIEKHGGAWLVNVKKGSNYEELNANEKLSLDNQLNEMIDQKYQFINYNGLRHSKLKQMVADGTNPFDNKVVIIDEAHNFVSRIVNKIEKEPKKKMGEDVEPKYLPTHLYKLLLEANNVKIVLLTGTPIINYPNEIGILFNILRGHIKTYKFKVLTEKGTRVSMDKLKETFKRSKHVDYILLDSDNLSITRNPFGFVNTQMKNEYAGVKFNEQADFVNDKEFKKYITRTLGKQSIQIVEGSFLMEVTKALPDTLEVFTSSFIESVDSGTLKNVDVFKRRILGLTSYFKSAQEKLMPAYDSQHDTHVIRIPMSNYQFGKYEEVRTEERKKENSPAKQKRKKSDLFDEFSSTYRIFSRAFCNFVFPSPPGRPMPKDGDLIETTIDKIGDEDDIDGISNQEKAQNIDGRVLLDEVEQNDRLFDVNDSYAKRIEMALQYLKENANLYLSVDGLETFSPKLLNILNNLEQKENKGLHLVYSQFRTIEGIGILSMVLEQNGYKQFKLTKKDGEYEFDITQFVSGRMFALYTGTETTEEKEIIRNIYNGDWNYLPVKLKEQLRTISKHNHMGEIIRVFMITASGAEGISLKNTRFVHIMEPYWHPVRSEQVIGRARRICSHEDLEPSLRNIKVFMYLMTFTDEQIKKGSIELRNKDKSKFDSTTTRPITSDEYLYEISNRKERINRNLLIAVKESAMDCAIHSRADSDEGLECYSFSNEQNSSIFAYKPNMNQEERNQNIQQLNRKKIQWKARKVTLDGKSYAMRLDENGKPTNMVYDLDTYKQALKNPNVNIQMIGKIVKKDNKAVLELSDK
jgi:hypothetical protein